MHNYVTVREQVFVFVALIIFTEIQFSTDLALGEATRYIRFTNNDRCVSCDVIFIHLKCQHS